MLNRPASLVVVVILSLLLLTGCTAPAGTGDGAAAPATGGEATASTTPRTTTVGNGAERPATEAPEPTPEWAQFETISTVETGLPGLGYTQQIDLARSIQRLRFVNISNNHYRCRIRVNDEEREQVTIPPKQETPWIPFALTAELEMTFSMIHSPDKQEGFRGKEIWVAYKISEARRYLRLVNQAGARLTIELTLTDRPDASPAPFTLETDEASQWIDITDSGWTFTARGTLP